jgi:hypothetical protein
MGRQVTHPFIQLNEDLVNPINTLKVLSSTRYRTAARWLMLLILPQLAGAANIELLNQVQVDDQCLTFATGSQTRFGTIVNGVTHQQYPLRTYRGYQYTIYYDDERQVSLGRRKLPDGAWEVIRFTDYNITNNDTHNVAVLGICENDGTIHLAFDHHRSNLHYRVSAVGVANDPDAYTWSPALFGPVTNVLGALGSITQVTYPRFVSMPNGNLMLYYRYFTSGNGDSMIRVYDGTTSQWATTHGKFIARDIGSYSFDGQTSNFRNAYINGLSYAGNRLHMSWIWRDLFTATDLNNQHDLCYAYSDDNGLTWNNSAGIQIAVTGSSFINVNSPGLVVSPIDPQRGLYNQNGQFAYPDGGIHVILPRYREGTSSSRYFHHHWRDPSGTWHVEELAYGGNRPELIGDDERNLFIIYTSGDNLRILKGVPNASFTAWSWSLVYNDGDPTTGGDAQIDMSRWHSERVLSVYGQEEPATILDYGSGTPIDGLPTPLNVTDFQVSLQAAQPNPSNGALHILSDPTLSWESGLNAVTHRIYFGTDPSAVAAADPASPEYQGEQAGSTFTPSSPLAEGTPYYWRIDEVESDTTVRKGLTWTFTVRSDLPPTLSLVPAQQTGLNESLEKIPVTLGDDQTPVETLILTASSSNSNLVPNGNITLGGTGPDRHVSITPAPDTAGYTTITLTANDGNSTNSTSFLVKVGSTSGEISMVVLGDSRYWTDGAVWSDSLAAHGGSHYFVPAKGLLRSPDGESEFPGNSLTVGTGASVQVRSNESSGTVTTIDNLFLQGGSTFDSGDFSEVIAGTGNDETNVIAGSIATDGTVRFRGYAGSTGDNPRSLRILSAISGTGVIRNSASSVTTLHTCFIDNPGNTFSGVWECASGVLEFASAEAVGSASIKILDYGSLVINGNWSQPGTELKVADSLNASIVLGNHDWEVAALFLGETQIVDGTYSTPDLTALCNTSFSGTGTITVNTPGELRKWRLLHFGTTENSGEAADSHDVTGDGEDNLMEFATAQNPHDNSLANISLHDSGTHLSYTYSRSKAAMADGFTFSVEHSDMLTGGTWSTLGVTEEIDLENDILQQVTATVPFSRPGTLFIRLSVEP